MCISDTKEDDNTSNSDLGKEPIQFKPHQPRYVAPLCHVTTSSALDDLLIIHTPNNKDKDSKALVDSGATKNFCSDSYVREKLFITYSISNPLRIRLADGSISMARHGVHIDFYIGTLRISKEFIVTRLSGQHQIILGYESLTAFNS